MPERIARLPIDARGYPVPYFVAWVDGVPDHRVADASKMPRAIKHGLCWICGERLGVFKTFPVGPMCAITRTVSEPPSHRECLQWSARACPFLTRPRAHRRAAGLPDEARSPAGLMLERNPGCLGLWVTRSFTRFRSSAGHAPGAAAGVLFRVGDPVAVEWFAEGRHATRAEVLESIASGFPSLQELAQAQDDAERSTRARRMLEQCRREAEALLPAA